LREQQYVKSIAEGGDHGFRGRLAAVIDHDHLEAIAGVIQVSKGPQTGSK
jgi:hypothetical protein